MLVAVLFLNISAHLVSIYEKASIVNLRMFDISCQLGQVLYLI